MNTFDSNNAPVQPIQIFGCWNEIYEEWTYWAVDVENYPVFLAYTDDEIVMEWNSSSAICKYQKVHLYS